MEKTVVICSSEFKKQAHKTVSLAFGLCEHRIKTDKGHKTLELKALSPAVLSLEKAVETLIATERLCK